MSHDAPQFADWELAMFRLGDLPPDRAAVLRQRLEQDPALAARLEGLDQREAELMDRLPPRVLAATATAPARARRRRKLWWLAAEVVAVALVLVLVLPPIIRTDQIDETASSGLREKGVEPYLRVFRHVSEGLEELDPSDPTAPGAQLQLSYAAVGRDHGAVLSVDGRGAITVHLPLHGAESAVLQPEGTTDLPASYRLDDAPHFERFFFVTAQQPFELALVLDAAQRLTEKPDRARTAPLDLPRAIGQSDFLLLKEPTP
jgi:hypothetical protein